MELPVDFVGYTRNLLGAEAYGKLESALQLDAVTSIRLNKGKKVRVHQTFPDSNEWRDLEFTGIIEQSGRDHIILSDPTNGVWEVLLMIYVDCISFDEPVNYDQDFYPTN